MITTDQIKELQTELTRFEKRLSVVKVHLFKNPNYKGKHTAALKRASMDLSRLLTKIRGR